MYYLRIENDKFGFVVKGIHKILESDISITDNDYKTFLKRQEKGEQFKLKAESTGSLLFDYIESFETEYEQLPKTKLELLIEENEIIKQQQLQQDENISLTEDAINFILMGDINTYNNKINRGNSMASYLGNQIYKGKLEYDEVIAKYPDFKSDIDLFLEGKVKNDGLKFK